jgi:hypothetical protein
MEIYSIGIPDAPAQGDRMVTVSIAVPFAHLTEPALWAASLESVRLALLADQRIIDVGGGQ